MSRAIAKYSKYSPEQIDVALLAFAHAGSYKRASAVLKAQGFALPPSTLRTWVDGPFRDRYLELHARHGREIEETAAAKMREFIIAAGEVERQALEQTAADLSAGNVVKDASTVVRNLAVSKAVNTEKMLLLSGRPTEIHETRNPEQMLRRLAELRVIEGTAEELPTEGSPA